MKRLFVYRSTLLARSETFIKAQILAFERWEPTLLGTERILGLPLNGLKVQLIWPAANGRADAWGDRVQRRLFWSTGIVLPHILAGLRRQEMRLMHAHFGPDALAIAPVARRLGLPLVVTLHGYDVHLRSTWWHAGHGGRYLRTYPERLLALSRQSSVHFIAVSQCLRERAIALGISPDRISVHYIGIDTTLFQRGTMPLSERPRRILFIGRLVEKKGCRYLIEAFARLRARLPDAELVVVGEGPLDAVLREQALTLRIPVRFAGALLPDAVARELDWARVVCVPSIVAENGDAEGLALVLLEAQAAGVPVVTSALGGATEAILPEKTGFAFAEKDVDALCEYLIRLLTDDALCAQFSAAAERFVRENFAVRNCSARLERIYDAIDEAPRDG